MAIPVTKDQKAQAKAEGKFLVQLAIDGRHLTPEQAAAVKSVNEFDRRARVCATGPFSAAAADELYGWFRKWFLRKGQPETSEATEPQAIYLITGMHRMGHTSYVAAVTDKDVAQAYVTALDEMRETYNAGLDPAFADKTHAALAGQIEDGGKEYPLSPAYSVVKLTIDELPVSLDEIQRFTAKLKTDNSTQENIQ